jgi:serine/threonine protein kinase
MKPCKTDEIRNPATNRCVKKSGKVGKELLKKKPSSNKSPRVSSKKSPKKKSEKKCKSDEIRNPATKRCVKKSGKIGKELLKKSKIKSPRISSTKSPKKTSEKKKTSFKRKFLGSGSYGKVYLIAPDMIEKTSKFIKKEYIEERNTREVAFLKSMSAPFVSTVHTVSIDKDDIVMTQTYAGITLSKYIKLTSRADRMRSLPDIMCQIARILVWLEDHRVAHMDIKPENICIDEDGRIHLTLIDFGFIGPICKHSPKYSGTSVYGDPPHLGNTLPISYSYDMFGMGLTILSYLQDDKFITDSRWWKKGMTHIELEEIIERTFNRVIVFEEIRKMHGTPLVQVLDGMLRLSARDRITSREMYNSPAFDSIRRKYPLAPIQPEQEVRIGESIDLNKTRIVVEWLGDVCWKSFKMPYLVGYASKLFHRILLTKPIETPNLQGYSIMCLLLGAMIFDKDISLKECSELCVGIYSVNQLATFLKDILTMFDWNVFPVRGMVDWDGTFTTFDEYKKWVRMCSDPDFIGRTEEEKYRMSVVRSLLQI